MIDKNHFFEIQEKFFTDIPFNQTKEWLESTFNDVDIIHYHVNNTETPEIAFWGKAYKRKYIGKHIIIDGVAIQTKNIRTIRDFFRKIIEQNYAIIELSDINRYSTEFEIGIRQAGFIRPMFSLSPLTIIVNTQEPFQFHRNWRRNVQKAINNELIFELIDKPQDVHILEFIKMFNQLKDRKKLSFLITKEALQKLFASEHYKLFFVKNKENIYLSGRIVYIQGNKSYDVYAANSDQGIKEGAAYYIQEEILKYLKNIGIDEFDYGRIPPSADEMNDIYVAKSYSGGSPVLYNGQWIYSKNKQLGLLYEFYKFFIRKQRRY